MNLAWRTLNHDIMKSSFPLSVCNCLVTHLGASDSLTTMVLYKSIYLLTYYYLLQSYVSDKSCLSVHHAVVYFSRSEDRDLTASLNGQTNVADFDNAIYFTGTPVDDTDNDEVGIIVNT